MRTVRINKIRRRLPVLLALLVLMTMLGPLAEPAEAARPPIGRIYYVAAIGLETGYDIQSQCFEFHRNLVCSLDGQFCGSWQHRERTRREAGISFDLTTVADGDLLVLEGQARLDNRGRKSSLAGTGRFGPVDDEDAGVNFSFAAREAGRTECLDLVDDSPDGNDGPVIIGSGNLMTEEREVSDFHGLVASGVGLIEIRHGATESLRITASDNILPLLTSEVRNGRLVLGSEGRFRTHDNNIDNIRFEITVREFDELTVAGVLGVDATGLDTELLRVNVSGVSAVTAAGRANRQRVSVAGVSQYDARDLTSSTVEIDVTGPSSAVTRVSNTLRGRVTGGATLEYIGNPTVDVTVDFVSTLRKIG